MKQNRSAPNLPTVSRRRRWHVVASALVAGMATAPSAAASPAPSHSRPVACFWEPAADVLPFGPELAGTVRLVDHEVEILHRVRCTNHTERWLWMPASYDGSPS
jgi:hypothetical protein